MMQENLTNHLILKRIKNHNLLLSIVIPYLEVTMM